MENNERERRIHAEEMDELKFPRSSMMSAAYFDLIWPLQLNVILLQNRCEAHDGLARMKYMKHFRHHIKVKNNVEGISMMASTVPRWTANPSQCRVTLEAQGLRRPPHKLMRPLETRSNVFVSIHGLTRIEHKRFNNNGITRTMFPSSSWPSE